VCARLWRGRKFTSPHPSLHLPPPTQSAARRFTQLFASRYGGGGPVFMEAPLMEVLDLAATEHKMVMVYIHSELHQDADVFCRCVSLLYPIARPPRIRRAQLSNRTAPR
jgi:hypothetical protein